MGDDNRGAVFHQRVQRLLHQTFRFGVERAGGLVQNQNFGVFQNGPGDGDALALSARQFHAALAHQGFHALGKRLNEIQGVGQARRLTDIVERSSLLAVGDVLADGAAEQNHLLGHNANVLPVGEDVVLSNVFAIHQNLPPVRLVKAQQQLGDGRLARSAVPHQGHLFAPANG